MDNPAISEYYRITSPAKRKKLLEEMISSGVDPEGNAIREELFSLRYQPPKSKREKEPIDALMRLWMIMEFDRKASKSAMSKNSCRKEILNNMDAVRFLSFQEQSALHQEILFEECRHMLALYISLSESDRNYRNAFMGLMSMSDEKVRVKLRKDIYETAVLLPVRLDLVQELDVLTRAARKAYEEHFPDEDPLPEDAESEIV